MVAGAFRAGCTAVERVGRGLAPAGHFAEMPCRKASFYGSAAMESGLENGSFGDAALRLLLRDMDGGAMGEKSLTLLSF